VSISFDHSNVLDGIVELSGEDQILSGPCPTSLFLSLLILGHARRLLKGYIYPFAAFKKGPEG
jgi:hypothetical protein